MTKILIDRSVVKRALHVATAAGYPVALIADLRAALAEPPEGDLWGAGYEAGYAAGVAEHDPRPAQEPAQSEHEFVGEVCWAANIPNTILEVCWKKVPPPVGTKLYAAPKRKPTSKDDR